MGIRVNTLAVVFSMKLNTMLGIGAMVDIIARNKAETDAHICHSHDFCDANMVMAEAMELLGVSEDEMLDSKYQALSNEAWAKAKEKDFYIGKSLKGGSEHETHQD